MSAHRTAALARGLAALAVLVAGVAGLPVLLLAVGVDPLPGAAPTWDGLVRALTSPDDGTLALGILTAAGWVCWAWFTVSVAADLVRRLRGRRVPLPGGGLASRLVGAVLIAAIAAPAAANAAAPAGQAPAAAAPAAGAAQAAAAPAAVPGPEPGSVVVEPGDTLWDIAADELGDPLRWPELAGLSDDTVQPDGDRLTDPDLIRPGWSITLPGPATTAAATPQPEPPPPAPGADAAPPPAAEPAPSPADGADTPPDDAVVTPLRPRQAPADADRVSTPLSGGGDVVPIRPAVAAPDAGLPDLATPLQTATRNWRAAASAGDPPAPGWRDAVAEAAGAGDGEGAGD